MSNYGEKSYRGKIGQSGVGGHFLKGRGAGNVCVKFQIFWPGGAGEIAFPFFRPEMGKMVILPNFEGAYLLNGAKNQKSKNFPLCRASRR